MYDSLLLIHGNHGPTRTVSVTKKNYDYTIPQPVYLTPLEGVPVGITAVGLERNKNDARNRSPEKVGLYFKSLRDNQADRQTYGRIFNKNRAVHAPHADAR